MVETEKEKLKRPIGIIIVMIWSALAITSLTFNLRPSLNLLLSSKPLLRQFLSSLQIFIVVLIIIELRNLWRFNIKAIYFADLLFGLWNVVILFTIFMGLLVYPFLTIWSVLRLSFSFVINLALIVYLTRHSFLDRCKILNKKFEDQKREEDRFKQVFKMRKL
jgi:heme exporter protein D